LHRSSERSLTTSKYLLVIAALCGSALAQSHIPAIVPTEVKTIALAQPSFDVSTFSPGTFDDDAGVDTASQRDSSQSGFVSRMVKRGLEDQKELYLAPFKPSNFKWDALVLAGTAGLLIADRHIENSLPGGNHSFYQTS